MTDSKSLRVLALEPFYGGSHRAFLDGWSQRSQHRWTVLGLPDHSWKWRMRHAAWTFARQIKQHVNSGESWDVIFCSDMLALAEFRGLSPASVARLPAVAYFHENQLTYPVREEHERDLHFAFSNLITAQSADAVWFNSRFHRDELLSAAERFLRRLPDHQPLEMISTLRDNSSVQSPGIETMQPANEPSGGPLHILWAARWEHDKNPEDLFTALDQLNAAGVDFHVSVIGQSFREVPPVFAECRAKLADKIVNWGYQESSASYAAALGSADVFVSTARHEFFGLAAVEAMVAGCFPLLPRRLAYPELVTGADGEVHVEFLYDGTIKGLTERLWRLAQQKQSEQLPRSPARSLAGRFDWRIRAQELDDALVNVTSQGCVT